MRLREGWGVWMLGALLSTSALHASSASAAQLDVGNPDISIRLDNTIRYNFGVRVEGQDSRIVANRNFDESDLKFGYGDVISNRIDLLTEFDASYRELIGVRFSGAFWYDNAYQDTDVPTNPAIFAVGSYNDGKYNSHVSRYYRGPSGELLDAFVYGRINLGDVPVDIKAGRHTIYWGEGLLFGAHAISYSQAPQDGRKAVASPGIETKEVFLPLGQVSVKAQLTEDLSVAAQYFLEWEPTRTPAGGTYLSSADLLLADRLPVGGPVSFPRLRDREPGNAGNWGVNARYTTSFIDGTVGVYYREFDDYTPLVQTLIPAGYRFVYAEDVKLYGLSFGTNLLGASAGFELSYRENGPLNSSAISAADNMGARGDTLHAIANAVWLLDQTDFYDTGTLITELAYSRLLDVTHNEALFRGKDHGGCIGQGAADGCSPRNFLGLAVNFTPQWLQVAPSLDLEMPLTLNYGVQGNGAPAGSSGNEGAFTFSVGMRAIYAARHELTLRYADQHADGKYTGGVLTGSNGPASLNDRGYVSLTYKFGF